MYLSDANKVRLVAAKIRPQFPDTNEGDFLYAVVHQALKDAWAVPNANDRRTVLFHIAQDRGSAIRYLKGSIPHAEICDVDADWIRWLLKKVELTL